MVDLKINLPDGFLKEETRCGYTITEEMKKVWAICLDLYMELDRVCKKHHIPYTASGGTLLGAIRHNGFIPWDDDIDIEMLREDYDRFCKIAEKEIRAPYFFQTELTDPGFPGPHAKLRRDNTTGMLKTHQAKHFRFHQGIFIDILPLDHIIENEALLEKQIRDFRRYRNRYERLLRLQYNYDPRDGRPLVRPFKKILHGFITGPLKNRPLFYKYRQKAIAIATKYNNEPTAFVSKIVLKPAAKSLYLYREDLEEIEMYDFEFLRIPIMKNYDRNLKIHYGDYMKPVQAGNYHGETIYDPEKDYSEYFI